MSSSDQEREHELAELLREVRALRETIDQLKAGPVLQPRLPPEYEVLVMSQAELPPNYAVAARQEFRPEYAVLARAQLPFLAPSYEVLVRPAIPEPGQSPIVDQ
jgi:hypothetical protein